MASARQTRKPETPLVPARLNLQRDPDTPAPTIAPNVTPAKLGHHFGSYAIVAPEARDQPAPSGFTAPLLQDSSLLTSPWAGWGSDLSPQTPNPFTVLQRAPAGFTHDLEEPRPAEDTLEQKDKNEPSLEMNPESEAAEGSSTPAETDASGAGAEAAPNEVAEAAPEAGGETSEAADQAISSEDASGVIEAQTSPEAELEAQKADSSNAGAGSPNEQPEVNADQNDPEPSNETVAETSSQTALEGSSEVAETSASTETAPEPVPLSEPNPESSAQVSTEEPSESMSVQASTAPDTAPPSPTEELEEQTPVQALHLQASAAPTTSSSASGSSTPDATLHSDVRSLSGGQALEPGVRSELESFHKTDLTSVQTFVNPDLTQRVQARAFTTGEKIVFNNAGDLENRELLAHETAHVKQQANGEVSGSSIAPGVKLSDPSDAFEREASSLGSSFARQPKPVQPQNLESSSLQPSSLESPVSTTSFLLERQHLTGYSRSSTTLSRETGTPSGTVFSNSATSSATSNTTSSLQRQTTARTSTDLPVQRSAWSWIKDKASSAWDGMKNMAAQGWGWVKDKASAALVLALETAAKAFGSTGTRIVEALKSVGSAIMGILQNPGAFISNLITGVKTGFMNFAANAKSHLTGILGQWLTGNSGVHFPAKFEPLEILKSIMSTVGASWNNLRGKITTKLGPGSDKAISLAEKSVPLVQNLSKGQFQNLEDVKAQVLPAVKTEAVEGLKDSVKTTVLQQGAIALLSRLNPAGGLVTIFKTVQFLVEKASSIASFVSSVWGGITNIAKGDVGGAAAKVESSLVSGVSLALNFLSKQIGLDGIVKKVQSVVHSISSRVNKVLEFVAGKAVKLVQPILEKIKGGFATAKTFATNTLEKGKTAAAGVIQKIKDGLFGRPAMFSGGGESHRVWTDVKAETPSMMMASTPREARAQFAYLAADADTKLKDNPKTQAKQLARDGQSEVTQALQEIKKTLSQSKGTGNVNTEQMSNPFNQKVANIAQQLFDLIGKNEAKSLQATMPVKPLEFSCKSSLNLKEFERQVAMAEGEMMGMTIETFLKRRSTFFVIKAEQQAANLKNPQGRDPEGDKAVREAKGLTNTNLAAAIQGGGIKVIKGRLLADAQHVIEILSIDNPKLKASDKMQRSQLKSLLENGDTSLDIDQAQAKADGIMAFLAFLHKLDQIAGGDPRTLAGEGVQAAGDPRVDYSLGAQWPTRAQELEAHIRSNVSINAYKTAKMNVKLKVQST
jgi:Domain of unknown function (DUF4157)/Novel toxin 15